MEITPQISPLANPQLGTVIPNQERHKTGSASGDSINMSNEALLLTEALRGAQTAPDIREDKVAELKTAIAAGTYNINARLIAEKIVAEETSLFI